MFQLAAKIEGHPDNVAPAIFGGIVISAKIGEDFVIRRVHPGGTLYAALAVPEDVYKRKAYKLPSACDKSICYWKLSMRLSSPMLFFS